MNVLGFVLAVVGLFLIPVGAVICAEGEEVWWWGLIAWGGSAVLLYVATHLIDGSPVL